MEHGYHNLLSAEQLDECERAFQRFDTDHNGTLDKDELRVVLKQALGEEPSQDKLDSLFESMDRDGNGEVSLDEFLTTLEESSFLGRGATQQMDTFSIVVLITQIIFLIFFCVFFSYPSEAKLAETLSLYPFYRDVAVMVLVGFGYLMAFLRRHRFGSLTYTFLITLVCFQWGLFVNVFMAKYVGGSSAPTVVSMTNLINALFTAAAVLISFGAWIGKVNGEQLLFVVIFEAILQSVNNFLCLNVLGVQDFGGSIVIHMFGAYFGVAATLFLSPTDTKSRARYASSSYPSDTFSLMATFFLWIFWPSFNAAAVPTKSGQTLAILNTVMAMVASGFIALGCSRFFRRTHKWVLEDLENSTLAGGVAIGASASILMAPGGAVGIGMVAGAISVLGYSHIGPFLAQKGLYDTAGVHNLHGMPSLVGGFASVIVVATRADTSSQFWYKQLIGIAVTLGMAIGGGLVVGWVTRKLPIKKPERLFNDAENFEVSVLCNHAPACGKPGCSEETGGTRSALSALSKFVSDGIISINNV